MLCQIEQWQFSGGYFQPLGCFLRLKRFQYIFGAVDNGIRQACQFCYVNPIGAVSRAIRYFVQENDLVLPLFDLDRKSVV